MEIHITTTYIWIICTLAAAIVIYSYFLFFIWIDQETKRKTHDEIIKISWLEVRQPRNKQKRFYMVTPINENHRSRKRIREGVFLKYKNDGMETRGAMATLHNPKKHITR